MSVVVVASNQVILADGLMVPVWEYSLPVTVPRGLTRLAITLNVPTLNPPPGGGLTFGLQAESSIDGGNEWSSDPAIVMAVPVPGTYNLSAPVSYNLFRFRYILTYMGAPGPAAWATFDAHVRFSTR